MSPTASRCSAWTPKLPLLLAWRVRSRRACRCCLSALLCAGWCVAPPPASQALGSGEFREEPGSSTPSSSNGAENQRGSTSMLPGEGCTAGSLLLLLLLLPLASSLSLPLPPSLLPSWSRGGPGAAVQVPGQVCLRGGVMVLSCKAPKAGLPPSCNPRSAACCCGAGDECSLPLPAAAAGMRHLRVLLPLLLGEAPCPPLPCWQLQPASSSCSLRAAWRGALERGCGWEAGWAVAAACCAACCCASRSLRRSRSPVTAVRHVSRKSRAMRRKAISLRRGGDSGVLHAWDLHNAAERGSCLERRPQASLAAGTRTRSSHHDGRAIFSRTPQLTPSKRGGHVARARSKSMSGRRGSLGCRRPMLKATDPAHARGGSISYMPGKEKGFQAGRRRGWG